MQYILIFIQAYADHRRLLKDGILQETRQGEVKHVYVIAFSDIIIFTTEKEKEGPDGYKFIVNRIEKLGSMILKDEEQGIHAIIYISRVELMPYIDPQAFQIILAETVIKLSASNAISKDDWIRSLQTC